ncbi:hypothetical protein GRI34_00725 [Erythrobacter aquimaris]|uniref:SMODS and SLOG-associating 2TM effector domain-containing protein n=1 Tax=Qipengyuania aquimaris TaxID=255984 RepID=A0A6I4TIF2_9SPHN|nr:hypothetical protein [Qipengyuania aquimaris]MXO94940.1 hypothetical protein [Qipengyuania aquimaris]
MSERLDLKPRLTLRIGITGHRPPRLPRERNEAVRHGCEDIFARAKTALQDIYERNRDVFSDDAPVVRLVSAMATGADTVAAEAALTQGLPLSACLPFRKDDYARDFEPSEWAQTQALIEAAESTVELVDHQSGDPGAYEAVGRLVLAQSDILIAVWDGDAARGRGGTTEVVAQAVASHMPVIHVWPDEVHPPQLLWSGLHDEIPDRPSIDGVERVELAKALPQLLEALCAPPEGEDAKCLQTFYAPAPRRKQFTMAWPLLLLACGTKSLAKTRFKMPSVAEARKYFMPMVEPFAGLGALGRRLNDEVADRFARADMAASYFALRFRSSFVTNFTLAALAVLLALSGLFWPAGKSFLIAAELLVIALIILNTRSARRSDFHTMWIDRRHLAERLRLLAMSSTLGRLELRDVEDGTTHPGWVTWYARATARELDMPPGQLDRNYLARVRETAIRLIRDQIAYHDGNAHLMEHTNHRLHQAGDWLFVGTILFCALYLSTPIFSDKMGYISGVSLAAVTTFATAFFPALAAALYGIRMQGDFAATAERSTALARRLRKLEASFERDDLGYTRLVDRIRRLSDIMLSDVHQWQQQYETRPITLPG